jgi:GNAT superfamily N-acetyltransferase
MVGGASGQVNQRSSTQNPLVNERCSPGARCFVIRCFTIGNVQLRPAEPTDAMAVARVHVRSWQVGYRKLMPDEYLDRLRPEDRAKKYDFSNVDPLKPHTIVLTEGGVIQGFATTAPAQDPNMSGFGELCALYVDPDHWGRGFGAALVSAARARLFDLGFRNAILWVLVGNVRAERFYLKDQWTPDGAQRTEEMWGLKINDVRYRRSLSSARES